MRRIGQKRSALRSPVASLIALAILSVCVAVGAEQPPAGWDDLAGSLRAVALGKSAPEHSERGLVQVEAQFCSDEAARATDLRALGAQAQFVRDGRVQCLVPWDRLLELAALPQVAMVNPPADLYACQGYGGTVSEAVQFTNASAMQMAGFTGTQCTIAIIDLGFADYDDAEIPASVQVISLRTDRSVSASEHGTAMAEQVADMAPDAELLLVAVDTPMSIEAAADYVASRGVHIAVCGLVTVEGPFDGSHALTRAVNAADAAGVLWVQAAGNLAQRHWAGTYSDDDGDDIHEFGSGVEGITLALPAGTFDAYLSWYETAGPQTSQDYDLCLVDALDNIVAQSSLTQNGDDAPRERLHASVAAATYRLQIRRVSSDLSELDDFQLFIPNVDISPATLQVPDGSLGIPAEASGAFTIGATRGTTIDGTPYGLVATAVDTIEPFSSLGPTVGGAIKPDLVAPDACRTSLAAAGATPVSAGGEFIAPNAFGTSFAAAHVAGALALIRSEDPTRTKTELRSAMVRLAIGVPPPLPPVVPLPNSTYGNGRLRLRVGTDLAKPTITITYPRSGETISTSSPTITAYLSDVGSGVRQSSIVLTLDGTAVASADLSYDSAVGLLSYRVAPPSHDALSRGSHRITIDCSDYDGNQAVQAVSSFRVSPPSIDAGLHMISLPYTDLDAGSDTPSEIFGLPPNQVLLVRWLPTDDTRDDKYHWYGGPNQIEDQYASLEPLDTRETPFVVSDPPAGLGYFLSIPASAILNVSGRSLADRISYDIKLSLGSSAPTGWNMIGCPFPDAVTWGGVEFITGTKREDVRSAISSKVTEGILYQLKRAGTSCYYDFPSDPLSGSLEPFKGYWIHVLKDTTLRVYNGVITSSAPTVTAPPAPSDDCWTLRFGASAGGSVDPANYIGIAAGATDGYDAGTDAPEPPALSSAVRVYMAREEWGTASTQYAKDVRGAVGAGQEWDVVVECSQPDADVTLSWPTLNQDVPGGLGVVLRDVAADRDVFMRTASAYTFRASGDAGTRHFKIIVTPGAGSALTVSGVQAQQASDGTVQFAYSVSCAANVEAEVLNIAGRPISQLGSRAATAGSVQTVTWNGRNLHGAKVPRGRYMLRLAARTEDGKAAHAVRTFQVVR